jgi:hypothetical protein
VGKMITALVAAGTIAIGAVSAVVGAPPASADGFCGSTVVWGNGGGQCDGPYYADGSFQRCVTVYVLGIGGSNCFVVPPPPPPGG